VSVDGGVGEAAAGGGFWVLFGVVLTCGAWRLVLQVCQRVHQFRH
jgi:hypothetical protein